MGRFAERHNALPVPVRRASQVKKVLLALLIVVPAGGAVAFVLLQSRLPTHSGDQPGSSQAPMLLRAPWEPYGYEVRQGPRSRSYNLPAIVTPTQGADPRVRILLDLQDEANYYFVELTRQRTRIGKVESGLETDLGTCRQGGLASQDESRVVIKRRYDAIEVVLNDKVVARAEDESFHGGCIGRGVLAKSATVELRRPQPCEPVYFADDFMKGATEETNWATVAGSWHVATLRNPSLSSNAFYYVGMASFGGAPASAVRGEWFWDNYRFSTAAMSSGTADIGIYFYYRDQNNYCLFRWNADTQPDGKKGRKQLVKRWHGGQEALLGEAPGGYQPQVWYQLHAEVVGSRVRIFIDGYEIFSATDPDLCFGQIGLYSAVPSPTEARFDDVLVQTVNAFEDDFSTVSLGRWRRFGGSWEQAGEGPRRAYRVTTDAPAKVTAGSERWRDCTLTARLRLPESPGPTAEVGIVSHYLDETNHALFAWQPASGSARLVALAEGKPAAEEQMRLAPAQGATSHLLEMAWKGAVLTARLDGQPVASLFAPGLPQGKIGLHAGDVKGLDFENVHVAFPLPPEPVLTTNEIFSHETSMDIWAGAANDWDTGQETIEGRFIQPCWHRADFPGDATVEVEIKGEAARAAAEGRGTRSCRLVLSAESDNSVLSGYNLVFAWPDATRAESVCKAAITRGKAPLAEGSVALSAPVRRLAFQRLGDHLVAYVNQEPVLAARDPRPLQGPRAAFATVNLPVSREQVTVFSDNVRVYTFSRASTDWRQAAGNWEISNRWECDPRWSFFSGVPDGSSLAAIWNKQAFEGDVTVEFAVGPKMENIRGGGNYRYARDFNVTICADGRDLSSGYSFLFGGWDNASTAIVRGAKIVARSGFVIPRTSGIHRRWFYIKVEKRGPTLSYWIDGSRVLSYTDPQPLPGKRIALWSWDCGIMVSRVRISASAVGGTEPPGTPRGPCRTLYSLQP